MLNSSRSDWESPKAFIIWCFFRIAIATLCLHCLKVANLFPIADNAAGLQASDDSEKRNLIVPTEQKSLEGAVDSLVDREVLQKSWQIRGLGNHQPHEF